MLNPTRSDLQPITANNIAQLRHLIPGTHLRVKIWFYFNTFLLSGSMFKKKKAPLPSYVKAPTINYLPLSIGGILLHASFLYMLQSYTAL
jgi:hypothetical protein